MGTGREENREGSSGKTEEMRREKADGFAQLIADSENIVFFGGAGVSTESGIPDFRSQDGLYHIQYEYPPETIISHHFFWEHTEEFYRNENKAQDLQQEFRPRSFQALFLKARHARHGLLRIFYEILQR